MNGIIVHLRASIGCVLAALVLPALLSAGELRTTITGLSKTCVGEELTVNATVEDFNALYAVHNVVTTVKVMQGATVVGTKTLSAFDLAPKQIKELTIATGWIPTTAGAYTVDVSADGTDDINGPQAAQSPLTVCANTPCPDRPSASGDVIYLGSGSTGSVTYSTPRPECCFEIKLTILTGRDVISAKSPENWTTITSTLPVTVTVDRSKWKADFLTVRLDWRSCDRKTSGSDYILIRNGDKPQASAPTTQPVGVTNGQTPQSGTDGDPVITSTREFVHPVQTIDAEVISATPLRLSRTFASLKDLGVRKEEDFGPGWSTPFDWFSAIGDDEAYVYGPNDVIVRFRRAGTAWQLDWPRDGSYKFAQQDDSTWLFGDTRKNRVIGFDGGGHLKFVDNATGYRNTMSYSGRFISEMRTPSGRGLVLKRDTVGRITEVSNGISTVHYGYTGGILTSFTDALGYTTQYNYAPGTSFLTSWRTPEGRTPFTVSYDAGGRVTSQDFGDGFVISFGTTGNVTTITYPLGITRTQTHDGMQRLTQMTNATGSKATFGYDASGNRNQVTDMEGGTVARTYTNGLRTSTTLANGSVVNTSYASYPYLGLTMESIKSVEVQNGPRYTFDYNANGTLRSFTLPTGAQTLYQYGSGRLPTQISGNGRDEQFTYDLDGLVATRTTSSVTTTYVRNAAGYITEEKQNGATTAQYGYDLNADLLTSLRSGATTTYTYDKDRSVKSITDAENHTWSLDRDARDRVSKIHGPSGATITYSWMGQIMTGLELGDGQKYTITPDANGHASTVTNALGQTWSIGSDNEGLPKSLTSPGGSAWLFQTNPFGNVTQFTTPLGRSWNYGYDVNGLLSSFREPNGVTTTTQRNANLTSGQTSVNGALNFSFDLTLPNANTPTMKLTDGNGNAWMRESFLDMNTTLFTTPLGLKTTIHGSRRGGITGIDYPGGSSATFETSGKTATVRLGDESLSWTVNNIGKVTKVGADDITYGASGRVERMNGVTATRSVGGRVTAFSLGSTPVVKYTYDARGYVNGIEDHLGGKSSVVYDDRGRITKYDLPGGYTMNYTFNYDDQIMRVANSYGWSVDYGRDNAGRITSIDRSDNVPLTPMVMPVDAPITFNKDGKIQSATYDTYGNLNAMSGLSLSYTFGSFGMKGFNSGALNYTIGLDDHGYTKSVVQSGQTSAVKANPMNDAASPLNLTTPSGSWTYVGLPNGMILYGINEKGQRSYYDNDGLGNIVAERDESGMVTGSRLITPYGQTVGKTGTPGVLGYQGAFGGLSLADDKFVTLGRWHYNPELGRFVDGMSIVSGYPSAIDPRQENPQVFTYDPFGSILGGTTALTVSKSLRASCSLGEEDYAPCKPTYRPLRISDQLRASFRPWIEGTGSSSDRWSDNAFGVDARSLTGVLRKGYLGYPKVVIEDPTWSRYGCDLPIDIDDDETDDPGEAFSWAVEQMLDALFPLTENQQTTPTPQPDLQPKRETQKKK